MFILTALLSPAFAGEASYGILCADISCASCQPAEIASASADSTLAGNYGAQLAFDGDLSTAWCEGDSGVGLHESINITLSKPGVIEAILVHGGYFKSAPLLAANGRVRALNMVAGDAEGPQIRANVILQDPAAVPAADPCTPGETMALSADEWFSRTQNAHGALFWTNDGDAQTVNQISFTLADVYPGAKYQDTCISEIQILMRE
ncbi:MAG: hypothetical protein ACI8RZ_001335 [Myxococcota bacterium]|jgi:hypothetical protein